MGLRWPVERTNSWLSNFGQIRRNTDRKAAHRLAQFALAIVFIIVAKLIEGTDVTKLREIAKGLNAHVKKRIDEFWEH